MTIAEFLEEIKSLEAFFEKELSIEQSKDWYEEIQNYSIPRLRVAIRECKRTCKFMPKLSEFLEFIKEAKEEKQESKKVECKKCNETGYLSYTKKVLNGNKILQYTYCCACDCENGLNVTDKIPREAELIREGYKEIYNAQNQNVFLRLERDLWQ